LSTDCGRGGFFPQSSGSQFRGNLPVRSSRSFSRSAAKALRVLLPFSFHSVRGILPAFQAWSSVLRRGSVNHRGSSALNLVSPTNIGVSKSGQERPNFAVETRSHPSLRADGGGFSSRLGERNQLFQPGIKTQWFLSGSGKTGEKKNRFPFLFSLFPFFLSPFPFLRGGLPKFARNFPAQLCPPNQSDRRFTASAAMELPLSKPAFFRDDSAKNPSKTPRQPGRFQQFFLKKTGPFRLDGLEKQRGRPRNLNKRAEKTGAICRIFESIGRYSIVFFLLK